MRADRRRWRAIGIPAAVALALLSPLGCHRGEPPEEPARRRVRCAPVMVTTLADSFELRGTISPLPDKDALIAAQVPGRIVSLAVREGDVIARVGQPVARLDDGPLVDEARAAEAALAKTRAELKNAQATAARVQRVFEHGIAARQEVDDATARAETAAAAQSEAEAALRRAARQVQRATVRSPLTGVVVRVLHRPGELVDGTPATAIVEVADVSRLELSTDATASDLVRARAGQRADVTVAALPGITWRGVVSAVSPAIDRATGLGVVRVALELQDAARPPLGVTGTARVQLGAGRAAVVVPKAAVRTGTAGGLEVVLCGADGVAHVRVLARGAATDTTVEAPGLSAGQSVAVDPVVGLGDGAAIEIAR